MAAVNTALRRLATSAVQNSRKTAVFSNGVIASWHPDEPVAFEKTKQINLEEHKNQSVLAPEVENIRTRNFQKSGPANVDLKEIFYTQKHEWLSRNREDRLRAVAAQRAKRH